MVRIEITDIPNIWDKLKENAGGGFYSKYELSYTQFSNINEMLAPYNGFLSSYMEYDLEINMLVNKIYLEFTSKNHATMFKLAFGQ